MRTLDEIKEEYFGSVDEDISEHGGIWGMELADEILYGESLEKAFQEDVEILRISQRYIPKILRKMLRHGEQ